MTNPAAALPGFGCFEQKICVFCLGKQMSIDILNNFAL